MFEIGMIPSPPDKRDYKFAKYNKPHALPVRFERPVIHLKDQMNLGSCVGFASSYCKDEHESRNHPGKKYETSPLYVYKKCKEIDGIPNQEGTYIRTACDVVRKDGACLEQTYSYSDSKPIRPIPAEADIEAAKFRTKYYTALHNINEIKQAIVDHGYVIGGFIVLSTFLNPEITSQGAFIAKPEGYILGGHAVSIIAYDDMLKHTYKNGETYTGFIKIVNSWRDNTDKWWGDEGTAWIPYELLFKDIAIDLEGLTFLLESWSWQDEITPVEKVKHVRLTIGSKIAIIDGEEIPIEQEPFIVPESNRTVMPLRFIAETFGLDVQWNPQTREIDIYDREVE